MFMNNKCKFVANSFENKQPDFMLQNFSAYFLNAPRIIAIITAINITIFKRESVKNTDTTPIATTTSTAATPTNTTITTYVIASTSASAGTTTTIAASIATDTTTNYYYL